MKQYPKYKDSGVSWIGEIPKRWNTRRLKFSCNLIQEKTTDSSLPYIALENIESYSGKLLSTNTSIPEGACNLYSTNDVLFSKLRPYLTKCVVAPSEGKCSSELLVLRDFEGENKYLQYLMLSPKYIEYIDSSTYGAKMPRANWLFIGNTSIPLPPLSEQRAIVSFLDKKTAQIDRFIAEAEREIEKLNELKQAQIAHLVTHGLNPDAPMKDSGIAWIGQIPEHWEVRRAKNIFNRMQREVLPGDEVITCFRDGQVTLRKNRRTDGFTNSLKEIGYQGIRTGDLVIHQMDAFAGSIGVSDSDGKGTPVYICCQPKITDCNNYYYAYLLREMARSGFVSSLYRGIRERSSDFRFETFAIQYLPIPPNEEQVSIVSAINSMSSKIDTLTTKLNAQIGYLKELKQRIISDAVTGKIDVREVNN